MAKKAAAKPAKPAKAKAPKPAPAAQPPTDEGDDHHSPMGMGPIGVGVPEPDHWQEPPSPPTPVNEPVEDEGDEYEDDEMS